MPTTSNGLRYPASSAAPNVPQDIQNLAADVDAKIDDDGWVSFAAGAAAAGWAVQQLPGAKNSAYRVKAGILWIRASFNRSGAAIASPAVNGNITDVVVLGTPPAALAIGWSHYFFASAPAGEANVTMRLNSSGTIEVVALGNDGSSIPTSSALTFSTAVPLD